MDDWSCWVGVVDVSIKNENYFWICRRGKFCGAMDEAEIRRETEGILEEFREGQRLLKEREDQGRLRAEEKLQEKLQRKRREKIRREVERIVEEFREGQRRQKEREEQGRLCAEEKLQEKLRKRRSLVEQSKEQKAMERRRGKAGDKVENARYVVYIPPRWNVYLGQPGRGGSCSTKRMERKKKKGGGETKNVFEFGSGAAGLGWWLFK